MLLKFVLSSIMLLSLVVTPIIMCQKVQIASSNSSDGVHSVVDTVLFKKEPKSDDVIRPCGETYQAGQVGQNI